MRTRKAKTEEEKLNEEIAFLNISILRCCQAICEDEYLAMFLFGKVQHFILGLMKSMTYEEVQELYSVVSKIGDRVEKERRTQ